MTAVLSTTVRRVLDRIALLLLLLLLLLFLLLLLVSPPLLLLLVSPPPPLLLLLLLLLLLQFRDGQRNGHFNVQRGRRICPFTEAPITAAGLPTHRTQ